MKITIETHIKIEEDLGNTFAVGGVKTLGLARKFINDSLQEVRGTIEQLKTKEDEPEEPGV